VKFHTIEQERLAQDSKLVLLKSMHDREVTQDVLAFECGVDRSTISRWCNPQSDQFPNLYLISNCAGSENESVHEVAMDMLRWLGGIAGCEVTATRLSHKPDGSLHDEFLDAAVAEGPFADAIKKNDLDKAEKIANKFTEIAQRMRTEIKMQREQKRARG
jgi:hypothetical protein